MSITPVAPDQIATVVTTLEMIQRPTPRPLPSSPLRLVRWDAPAPDRYRALFARVGGPWLWFSRLAMTDAALTLLLADRAIEVHAALDSMGIEVGMLELDRSEVGVCRIAYLGVVPELTGRQHGRWLVAHALALGWRPETRRIVVHTCTLDHPHALGFYRAQGFTPVSRAIETFPDPRLIELLPPDAAPQIPMLGSLSRR